MTTFKIPLANGVHTFAVEDVESANHLLTFQYTEHASAGTITVSCRAPGAPIGSFIPVSGGDKMPVTQNNLLDFKFPIVEIQFVLENISGDGHVIATLSNW